MTTPKRGTSYPRPRRRPGATFLEILIAMAILAAAMVPISSMLVSTAGQTASTKAESQAANFAASLMNRFLDKEDFDAVTDGLEGEENLDGTDVKWNLEVHDFLPPDINLAHRVVRYHNPVTPGCAAGEAVIDASNFDASSEFVTSKSAADLDRKNQDDVILKELRLRIQWKTVRDPGYEQTTNPNAWRRTVILLTRRARLKRRTP